MASTTSNNSTSNPSLCVKGCGFYGNPATSNICSKCFKDLLNLTEERLKLLAIAGKPLNVTRKVHETDDDDDDTIGASTSNNDKKKKKNRCESCNKRIGLTGFKCRCGGLFCGLHRYPEEHACFFDYKAFGRLQLEKQNPNCGRDKLLERA